MRLPDDVVSRYYLYKVTLSLGFYVPVSVVYLRDLGFSLAFVGLTWTVFSASLLAAEIPTGYLADRVGRRWTLLFGTACRIVGIGGYALASSGSTFLLLKVFTGVGWALRSGTTDAFLYELLADRLDEDRFTTVKGRGQAVQLVTSAATALAGGVLYSLDPTLPFVATAVLAAVGVPVLLSLPATGEDDVDPFTVRAATHSIRQVVTRPELRWLVAYTGLVLLVFTFTRTFEQPALRAIGIDATGLGVLYAAFKLVSAGAGAAVGPLEDRLGTETLLLALAPLTGVVYVGLLVTPAFLLPVAFCYRFVHTLVGPVRNQYLNDRLPDAGRATVLSAISMLLSSAAILVRLAGSALVGAVGTIRLIGLVGAGFATIAAVVWLSTSPVRSGTGVTGRQAGEAAGD
jgi:MFS family permease